MFGGWLAEGCWLSSTYISLANWLAQVGLHDAQPPKGWKRASPHGLLSLGLRIGPKSLASHSIGQCKTQGQPRVKGQEIGLSPDNELQKAHCKGGEYGERALTGTVTAT